MAALDIAFLVFNIGFAIIVLARILCMCWAFFLPRSGSKPPG